MTRPYTSRETRWVTEYVMKNFPEEFGNGKVVFQYSVGPLAAGLTMRAAPRVDAIIFQQEQVVLVEADAENITSAIGQLEYYRAVLDLTPHFPSQLYPKRRSILLLESFDSTLAAFAASKGIEVDTWAPDWLKEYLFEKRGRRR